MTRRGLSRLTFVSVLVGLLAVPGGAQPRYPGKQWQTAASPEAVGWSAEKLQRARAYADSIGTAALVIVQEGLIVAEWGETARKFRCHSIRKSFLSALYGIHVRAGRIDLSATLAQLGISDNGGGLTPTEKQATVGDLLKARSGIYHPALYETPAMKVLRPPRGSHSPGSFWYYNNWDFNALGTIFEQQTGTKIFEEFARRIAAPTEMEDFRVEDGEYFFGPDSSHPAYPFRMTARDMARFGLLFLRQGRWRDQPVIPADWVRESTTAYSDAGEAGGYGYMWWVAVGGRHLPGVKLPNGSYSAQGAGGHYILVIPAADLVIVHRVNSDGPGPHVSDDEFGHLVKLILEAQPQAH